LTLVGGKRVRPGYSVSTPGVAAELSAALRSDRTVQPPFREFERFEVAHRRRDAGAGPGGLMLNCSDGRNDVCPHIPLGGPFLLTCRAPTGAVQRDCMISNPLAMTGRTVLVTGASSGIGRETAILLSELEATVIIAGRNRERLSGTRERMRGSRHRIEAFDLGDAAAIPAWIKRLALETGPLFGLVHSAGIHKVAPLRMMSPAGIEEVMRANVTSAMMLVSGFRQRGCSVRGSSIVLISSVAGLAGQAGIGAYSASKAALIGFSRSAAMELAGEGIRVNCVAPGIVETEMADELREKVTAEQFAAIEAMHPLGLGKPLDVAFATAFLLGDTARWITGTTLVVDGGYTAR